LSSFLSTGINRGNDRLSVMDIWPSGDFRPELGLSKSEFRKSGIKEVRGSGSNRPYYPPYLRKTKRIEDLLPWGCIRREYPATILWRRFSVCWTQTPSGDQPQRAVAVNGSGKKSLRTRIDAARPTTAISASGRMWSISTYTVMSFSDCTYNLVNRET